MTNLNKTISIVALKINGLNLCIKKPLKLDHTM